MHVNLASEMFRNTHVKHLFTIIYSVQKSINFQRISLKFPKGTTHTFIYMMAQYAFILAVTLQTEMDYLLIIGHSINVYANEIARPLQMYTTTITTHLVVYIVYSVWLGH